MTAIELRDYRYGHLHLSFAEQEGDKPHEVWVPLKPVEELLEDWLAAGALLAAQALAPIAAMPKTTRDRLGFLGEGPGVGLAAWIALHLGCPRVEAVLHPKEIALLQEAVDKTPHAERFRYLRRIDEAEDGAFFQLVAYGCDGSLPDSLAITAPLVKRMRPEGQLLLFGLPEAELEEAFDRAAKRGLSLRAMGVHEKMAFFAGSLEQRHDFR